MTPDGDSRLNRAAELSYAGGLTFLKLPLVPDAAGLAGADAAIIGAPMDEAVSDRPGARFGPRAIRLADFFGGGNSEARFPFKPEMNVGQDLLKAVAPGLQRTFGHELQMLQLFNDRPVVLVSPYTVTVR